VAVKPRILVSSQPRIAPTSIGPTPLEGISRFYVEAVLRGGGVPFIAPLVDPDDVPTVAAGADGVVLTGGGDVDPACYGAEPAPETEFVDGHRDAFDLALVAWARESGVPVLAICRGMQVVNVALGGPLIQHVPAVTGQDHHHPDRWNEGVHRVRVEGGSRLADVLGARWLDVNSLHHQAVSEVPDGLRPVAWAGDGTVEGMESADGLLVAVQWHPELLAPSGAPHQALFADLAARAGAGVAR
jgi:putative glutamine amidotransferase